jgi:murein L,D-transpeptidase YcbB/YkuD
MEQMLLVTERMRALCALFIAFSLACASRPRPHEVAPALQELVSGKPLPKVEPALWTDVRAFYLQREHMPAWVNQRRPTQRAAAALQVLQTARQHGFDGDYGAADLLARSQAVETIDKESPERLRHNAEFDARLTAALLAFARDVAIGRGAPPHRKARRKAPDYLAALAKIADGDPKDLAGMVRPSHPEYAALQQALDALYGQKEKGGWTRVPGVAKPGSSGPGVAALRQRLAMSGQLKADPAASDDYDDDVTSAVKSFQELHAIKGTGVVDAPTLAALNVPLDARIRQVALNLQRWRAMPDELGERHFIVNVPHFHLIAREHGKPVMDIRVVVGKPGNNTPLFSDEMESVVFSPYWNIPDSIAQGETLPAMARDPSYLAKQNIEILRVGASGEEVDPDEVDWNDPEALKGYAFRQKPGSGNALGHVKFLFPNAHNVYLHDTPADNLFGRPTRAFSHGCVRVEEPETLAQYVLRDDPEWDQAAIARAMHSGVEKHVALREKIPVHIVYFTAWVDQNGGLHFQPDIYGYDQHVEN